MEGNPAPAPAQQPPGRRELSIDPVKAQGVLTELTRKERHAAELWPKHWGFYTRLKDTREEQALKMGMSLEDYRAALRALSCQPEPRRYCVDVEPSPAPLPRTSNGVIGRRARCSLERFGKLVVTGRDVPLRPPLPPGQLYDPYKQTIIFLGSIDCGDPISYKLPASHSDVPEISWSEPRQLEVTPFCRRTFEKVSTLHQLRKSV